MLRVVVAEDHHIVREGICRLLEEMGDIQVVGEADNGEDAIKLIRLLKPNVLVLDISMPHVDGIQMLKEIRIFPSKPRVVILSMYDDVTLVQQALEYGALGYVLKQSVSEELLDAVRAASRGSLYLSSEVSHILSDGMLKDEPKSPLDRLSPREREVVEQIVAGKATKEIAQSLGTSVKTVEKQRRDAMRKLEADNTASLVRISMELGLATGEKPRSAHR
jgi:DNA-binding NarL/FixJ family response regulator